MTDGRFSGASHGIMVGHVTPEAADGGALALVRDGDSVCVDLRVRANSIVGGGGACEVGGGRLYIEQPTTSTITYHTSPNKQNRTLTLEIPPDELEHRKAAWALPPHVQEAFAARRGVFKKYTLLVRSAHVGAVTH